MRLPIALAAAVVLLGLTSTASAWAPTMVLVHSRGAGAVRLQVSEGPGASCDSSLNAMRFDGTIAANQAVAVGVAGPCACVRSTSVAFPEIGWDSSRQVCLGRRNRTGRINYELEPP